MINQRLRRLRLARGYSLEKLASEMGGIVTKQAISKYEKGTSKPSPSVLNKLSEVFKIKSSYLWAEPAISVKFIAYRKKSSLPKKEMERIENYVEQKLEERIRLQDLLQQKMEACLPVQDYSIKKIDDVEQAAINLRNNWSIGLDPIANVIDLLETHLIHIIDVNTSGNFDGLTALGYEEGKLKAAAIALGSRVSGERQRFNLTHELGHIVLDIPCDIDEEKAAYRFGLAFLAPESQILKEVGAKRSFITLQELLFLKSRFGLSIQALLYRLKDLGVINNSYYKNWCIEINKRNWKKNEPAEMKPEKPVWLRQNILRAISEGIVTQEEANSMIDEEINIKKPQSLKEKQSFIKLPLEERHRILTKQAEKIAEVYDQDSDIENFQGGDIVDY
ncbi:MAG: XRE family transcriptional regulator [Actinobacteria bacterium]|nr:XRE family transcriptional regulator [Actinomycetota bacterium]